MRRLGDIVILLALIGLCSLFICQQAIQVFDFYDMSAFIDAGYRVWRGQKIYVDFFYIAGPIHPYFHALSFWLFGFNKTAILVHLCVEQAVCLSAVYVIARRYLGLALSAALTLLTCGSLFGPIAHPWYDQTAIAFFLVSCICMVWGNPPNSIWRIWGLPAISGGCMALSFLTKTNIGAAGGGMMFLGYVAIALTARNSRPVFGYVIGGVVVLAIVVLTLPSPRAYIFQNFLAFNTSGRLFAFFKLELLFVYHPYLPMALAGAFIMGMGGWKWCVEHVAEVGLFVITWVTGIFSAYTGSAVVESYCFFWGLISLWLCIMVALLPKGVRSSLEWRISRTGKVIIWASMVLMFLFLWSRQLRTWMWQPGNMAGDYVIRAKALEGWKCRADIGRGVDASVAYIDEHVPVTDSLWVMPDCTIIYALTNHDSYRKVPWSLNRDNGPGRGPMWREMMDHFDAHPPQWILERSEENVWPIDTREMLLELGLYADIQENYDPVFKFETFTLLKLKTWPQTTTAP